MMLEWHLLPIAIVVAAAGGPVLTAVSRSLCDDGAPVARAHQIGSGLLLGCGVLASAAVASTVAALVFLVLTGAVLIVVSMVDLREQRIPDVVTYPAMAVCALVTVTAVLLGIEARAVSALIGAGTFAAILLVPHLMRPESMGFGDVKLAVPLGFVVGWVHGSAIDVVMVIGWTVAAASVAGLALAAVQHGASRRTMQKAAVPFGPALSVAAWGVVALTLAGT